MSATGGITKGKSHKEGGIPMVVKSTGQQVELEGGEGVINKRNMASTKTFEFEGKEMSICQIASAINSADGNGVKIDCDDITGKKYKYDNGGGVPRRTLAYGDAVLYKNETWYISKQNGVVGIVFLGSGAWGSSYPFIPLSRIDVENQLTDMFGNKISIAEFEKGGKMKPTLSIEDYQTAEMSLGGYEEGTMGAVTEYKGGGDIEIPKANKMFHLPLEIAVYVPSTSDVDMVISESELNNRVKEVSTYLSSLFGGYTSSEKIGGYMASNKELVIEDVVPVTSFATKSDFESNKSQLISKMSDWAKEWGQEAIGFEFEGDLYYVPQEFKTGGEISRGIKTEMEHKDTINKFKRSDVTTKQVARAIAKDHLKEDRNYYKKLDILERSTLDEILQQHDKNIQRKRNRKSFALGGSTAYNPHLVDVVFHSNAEIPIYTNEGKYDGESLFKKDVLYNMEFLNNRGTETALQFPLSNKYVIVPNELITIRGYEKKFMKEGGNVPNPYEYYKDLISEHDMEVLYLLRGASNSLENLTIEQKDFVCSFKGVNNVNQLSSEMISKLYGILFKDHNNAESIKTLWINNVGNGTILNYAPSYLHQIKVSFTENPFINQEELICSILNEDLKKWSLLISDTWVGVNSIIHVYQDTDPKFDALSKYVDDLSPKGIALGFAEFTSVFNLDTFVQRVKSEYFKDHVVNFYKIHTGITERGTCSLIYNITR